MNTVQITQGFAKPLIHIIDREADSVRHIRRWQGAGWHWLVRAKDNPTVVYEGQSMGCKQVAQQLIFSETIPVDYKGKKCSQWVAEADVVIARAAKPSQAKPRTKSPSSRAILYRRAWWSAASSAAMVNCWSSGCC